MKVTYKALIAAIAVGVGLSAFVGTSMPASAQVKILIHQHAPPAHPNNSHGWDWLIKNVERDTEGRVVFEYTPGAIGPAPRNWDHVVNGIVDAAFTHSGFERSRLWLPELGRLPGNTPTATAQGVAMWRTHKKFFEVANEHKGVKLLSLYAYTGEQIFTLKKPINSVADLKGLKLRSGAGLAKDIFSDLGIAPVPSLVPEIFPMISKGVVDGMTGSAALAAVVKVERFLKYGVEYPGAFNALVWSPILNQEKWDSIPTEDQEIMNRYLGEPLARSVGGRWDSWNDETLERMKASGAQIHAASPEMVAEVKQITAKYTDEWLEKAAKRGVDGQAAMDYFHRQLNIVLAEKN